VQQLKELEDLRGAAREMVDMVDPPEEGDASSRPLLEQLHEAPKKVLKFLTEAPVACVSNALAVVKFFFAERAIGDICSGHGCRLHRGSIRPTPPRSPTCSGTNSSKCTAGLGSKEQVFTSLYI
jgi:hypothetical protein